MKIIVTGDGVMMIKPDVIITFNTPYFELSYWKNIIYRYLHEANHKFENK